MHPDEQKYAWKLDLETSFESAIYALLSSGVDDKECYTKARYLLQVMWCRTGVCSLVIVRIIHESLNINNPSSKMPVTITLIDNEAKLLHGVLEHADCGVNVRRFWLQPFPKFSK